MLPIKTILHPTDFSSYSENAFRVACSLARDHGARVVVLHVVPPMVVAVGEMVVDASNEERREAAETALAKIESNDATVALDRRLADGDPAVEILRVAEKMKADLIVMGTHGRTGLSRLLMGSVAEVIVRKANCMVLTVKSTAKAAVPASKEALATA